MIEIQVDKYRHPSLDIPNSYQEYIEVEIEEPELVFISPYHILQKAHNYPIAVYKDNVFVEMITRTVYPRAPLGCWMVFGFRYHRKWYKSLCDDIYGYLKLELDL